MLGKASTVHAIVHLSGSPKAITDVRLVAGGGKFLQLILYHTNILKYQMNAISSQFLI